MAALPPLPRPATTRLAVRLTPDALRRVRGGHPWVFADSITSVSRDGAPGDLVVVFGPDRAFAAIGLWDPASPIRIKVLHQGKPVTVDRAFWVARLAAALAVRQPLLAAGDTTGYRVINGENDGFPGLVLDAYDRTLVLKLYSAAWVPHLADVLPAVEAALRPSAVVLRLARQLDPADLHGLEEGDALVGVPPDGPVLFHERGLVFEADVVRGQKTGHFLDQRDNRALAGALAAGGRVLDVFASTGGFTVHAAAGGATEVMAVDLSAPTLAVAERNVAHNAHRPEVAACRVRPVVADAFDEMERLGRRGERFDLVVVDPPSFAQRQQQVPRALAAYARLTELAVRLVRPGGALLQCSCSSRVGADQFHAGVARAAARAGRPLTELRRTAHAVDHPVTFPEGAYLKAVLADVP
ncbi:MAG: class I SAM-dependent methyltransferase [Ilumatobacter sp.]|nr:class I SAM-dependent methyltransferase [Ilumatobacter sp.]MCB0984782.1 class I SAM-dependent methyltransferase [Ilumatobacter sp.]